MNRDDIIWLAGLIDGEGCFHSHLVNVTRNLSTQIQIHCASKTMIDCVEKIYNENKIDYKREEPFRQPFSTKDTHRITVRKRQSVLNLSVLLFPFLRVKKEECILVVEYYNKVLNDSIKPSLQEREIFVSELKRLKRV